jgi:phage shock protein A
MNQNTTLKQYAFAIGFDFESSLNAVEDPPGSEEIAAQLESISATIQGAGLPALNSDRWDEFGQGRIFWGTKSECDAIKLVLSQFPLFVQEERNLESGYYATSTQTYYADEAGNLYQLITPADSENGNRLELILSIPLDAYRLKVIDPNLQAAVERSLSTALPEQDVGLAQEMPPPSVEPPIPAEMTEQAGLPISADQAIAALQAQVSSLISENEILQTAAAAQKSLVLETVSFQSEVAQQAAQIYELERQVTAFEDQIAFLQGAAAAKIDPQLHADVQAQLAQQIQQIQQTEARLAQAETQVKEWQSRAEQGTASQVEALLQQLNAKATQTQELQQRIQRLEQQLQDAVAIAAQKIEPSKYQALEQSMTDITAQAEGFRRTIQQLQRDLNEWQTVADSKVEWSEYQTLQEELRQLQVKQQKRGLFSRLFGWLFR